MDLKTLVLNSHITILNPKFKQFYCSSTFPSSSHRYRISRFSSGLQISPAETNSHRNRLITGYLDRSRENFDGESVTTSENDQNEVVQNEREGFVKNESIWNQMAEIVKFSGPAGQLMSLIDTVVVGQSSSIELAALGPWTVLCDDVNYIFMFLSIATSNLVATSLARKDKDEVQHQISILLFIGLACGVLMLFLTRCLGAGALMIIRTHSGFLLQHNVLVEWLIIFEDSFISHLLIQQVLFSD